MEFSIVTFLIYYNFLNGNNNRYILHRFVDNNNHITHMIVQIYKDILTTSTIAELVGSHDLRDFFSFFGSLISNVYGIVKPFLIYYKQYMATTSK